MLILSAVESVIKCADSCTTDKNVNRKSFLKTFWRYLATTFQMFKPYN